METSIAAAYKDTPAGQEADAILRSCVHCGFCTATCPTYQLLGDELDGPRGRIYLIKQVLEGQPVSRVTQRHLDRCLTCTACETTCPSGVRYHHLLEIGRGLVEDLVPRSTGQRLSRALLRAIIPFPKRLAWLLRLGRMARPILPERLHRKLPDRQRVAPVPGIRHSRRVLVPGGCAQAVMTPATGAALARVLDRIGISVVGQTGGGCCGAVSFHLAARDEGLDFMRRNIDAWWPYVEPRGEQGLEAIVVSASGCAAMVKDYGHCLRLDPTYAEKAERISMLAKDPCELLGDADLSRLQVDGNGRKVAFHSPCTLQHTQKLPGRVESILKRLGFELTQVADPHLCCGSAGTYSLLQPDLSERLLTNKLASLESGEAELIATANVGCQLHLQSQARVPVRHWIELLDSDTDGNP